MEKTKIGTYYLLNPIYNQSYIIQVLFSLVGATCVAAGSAQVDQESRDWDSFLSTESACRSGHNGEEDQSMYGGAHILITFRGTRSWVCF